MQGTSKFLNTQNQVLAIEELRVLIILEGVPLGLVDIFKSGGVWSHMRDFIYMYSAVQKDFSQK